MIFIDSREGSKSVFTSCESAGLPCELTTLEFGDMWFVGRGNEGAALSVGIEHKSVSDCVTSIRTERLQGFQLPGMRNVMKFDMCWLVIEGELLVKDGELVRRASSRGRYIKLGMSADEFYKRLTTLHLCGGLNWLHFEKREQTVQWLSALYHSLTDKDLDDHKSHLAIYQPPALVSVSQCRQTLHTLPGVALSVSKVAEQRFKTIRRAINASAAEWAALETRDKHGKTKKFGMSHAVKVVEAVTT